MLHFQPRTPPAPFPPVSENLLVLRFLSFLIESFLLRPPRVCLPLRSYPLQPLVSTPSWPSRLLLFPFPFLPPLMRGPRLRSQSLGSFENGDLSGWRGFRQRRAIPAPVFSRRELFAGPLGRPSFPPLLSRYGGFQPSFLSAVVSSAPRICPLVFSPGRFSIQCPLQRSPSPPTTPRLTSPVPHSCTDLQSPTFSLPRSFGS